MYILHVCILLLAGSATSSPIIETNDNFQISTWSLTALSSLLVIIIIALCIVNHRNRDKDYWHTHSGGGGGSRDKYFWTLTVFSKDIIEIFFLNSFFFLLIHAKCDFTRSVICILDFLCTYLIHIIPCSVNFLLSKWMTNWVVAIFSSVYILTSF